MTMRELADAHNATSVSNRMRSRRFKLFEHLVAKLPRPVRILDVGGTNDFWRQRGWAERSDVRITMINLKAEAQEFDNIEPRVGDATNLSEYDDGHFDVAFSNSVIEHLFTYENQAAMAREMSRVGQRLWLQTPNYWFPVEPHFHVLGWQWMPLAMRVALIRRRDCGWRQRTPDPAAARQLVAEVRLMTRRELRKVFPGAMLVPEHFAGLVKSWVVLRGFERQDVAAVHL